MPLQVLRMVPHGHLIASDIKQYADLFMGVMGDQPVIFRNTLQVVEGLRVDTDTTMMSIATPEAPPAGMMKIYPKADREFYKLDEDGVETLIGSGGGGGGGGGTSGYHEEYYPDYGSTQIYLAHVPTVVLTVARGGVVQSEMQGHYTVVGNLLSFAAPFGSSECVVVAYLVGSSGAINAHDLELRAYVQGIMLILDPGGPPPPV